MPRRSVIALATSKADVPPLAATSAPGEEPANAKRVSSSDHIVREIMRGLYQGRYVPGQKLTEADLTRRFSVGRGSVREALTRLAAEGVVTISRHRGARIRALSRQEARDVLEVVETLASLAARLAAARLETAKDVDILRGALKTLAAANADSGSFEFARLRDRLYRHLAQISGNRELARLLPTVQAHLIRVQFRSADPDADRHRAADYQRIIEAVLAKDPAKAERAMRIHVRAALAVIDALPEEAFAF